MLRLLRPWHFFLIFTAVVAAVAGARASRPVPTPSNWSMVNPPTFDDACRMRTEYKQRIAAEAAAGRLSLLAAATAFKELDATGAPYPQATITNDDPSVSVEEVYYRMVIRWVQVVAQPDQVSFLTLSLQDELESRLRDGTLHLPEKCADSTQDVATARFPD